MSRKPTQKYVQAIENIMDTLRRLPSQWPFPVDPMKFYEGCMPAKEMGWLKRTDTRSANLSYLTRKGDLAHFTCMHADDYQKAVLSDSLLLYDDVFWLRLPERVVTWDDTCDAINIPRDHFAFKEVMQWWDRNKACGEYLNVIENTISELSNSIGSIRELAEALPELVPFYRMAVGTSAPISKRRQAHLKTLRASLLPEPEIAHLVEQLNTASLLPEYDDGDAQYGINWR